MDVGVLDAVRAAEVLEGRDHPALRPGRRELRQPGALHELQRRAVRNPCVRPDGRVVHPRQHMVPPQGPDFLGTQPGEQQQDDVAIPAAALGGLERAWARDKLFEGLPALPLGASISSATLRPTRSWTCASLRARSSAFRPICRLRGRELARQPLQAFPHFHGRQLAQGPVANLRQ